MEPGGLFDCALRAHQTGNLRKARRIYQQLVALDPNHAGGWMNLGLVHQSLGASDQALAALERAAHLAPENGGVQYNLGNTLRDSGDIPAAIIAYRKALDVNPEFTDAHNNLGETLMRQDHPLSAIAQFRTGLKNDPKHLGLRVNLGNAYYQEGEIQKALKELRTAKKIAPNNVVVSRNLGNILRTSGRVKDAEKILQHAIRLAPNDASSHVLLALCKFTEGQFGTGWDGYAWRWRSNENEPAREFPAPFWKGQSLKGKTLLIWGEQAVGDELMFATMYGDFASFDTQVYIETEFRLRPLFQRSFPNYKILSRRDPPDRELRTNKFDYQIAAGDIGRYLRRSISDFSNSGPFLKPDQRYVKDLRNRYMERAKGRRLVGLSWNSGSEQVGISRSIPIEALKPLLENRDILFVNLQYGDTEKDLEKITTLGIDFINDALINPLKDLDRAAAQIASLDLVVTIANTTAHLSGALGIPTWVILSKFPDWRWGAKGYRTPWYSSVRLYRQKKLADWHDPIEEVTAIL